MFSCLLDSRHGLVIYMPRLSSNGDICASVSHDAAAAPPTFPIAVGKPYPTPPLPLSLSPFRLLRLSTPLSLLDSLGARARRRGTHRDEIEVGSCSFSPRVII